MTFLGLCAIFYRMNEIILIYTKIERFFGHLKFAVFIILIFAIYLTYGTFMESYHGTDYANRLVYKSIPFMLVQALMFSSIMFATTSRLPFKKTLAGFYVLHLGLLLIFIGSVVTYVAGVDGNMTLYPNTPQKVVNLNKDQFKIQIKERNKEYSVDLPYSYKETPLNLNFEKLKILRFLPFAEDETNWIKSPINSNKFATSASYILANDQFQEYLTLSLHPESDFESTTQMGPLSIHYMPRNMLDCFKMKPSSKLILWDSEISQCLPMNETLMRPVANNKGSQSFYYPLKGKKVIFIPELSPLPLDEKKNIIEDSPYRIFSTKLFEEKPHLFLFGTGVAFFDKNLETWETRETPIGSAPVELPWMGFKIRLEQYSESSYPKKIPTPVKPIQENSQVVKGKIKALELMIDDEIFWIKQNEPLKFRLDNEEWNISLGLTSITLPFEIILNQFKMDTDPGTRNPASYESFVTLFKGNAGAFKHHVFMNNPLKEGHFTLYQASYFEVQENVFGSVFSVNYDPGRFLKYLGSLLLVLGSIWHFLLRKKRS